jgi:hypothetical protein
MCQTLVEYINNYLTLKKKILQPHHEPHHEALNNLWDKLSAKVIRMMWKITMRGTTLSVIFRKWNRYFNKIDKGGKDGFEHGYNGIQYREFQGD